MADHIALYRTYRPRDFASLVGQDHVKQTLLNASKLGKLAQVYLFSGPRGTGKTTVARLVAKALTCENRTATGDPCNQCRICQDIQDGRMIDVIEIDGASNRGIDEVRALRENALFLPAQARKKVYIIDEVHMLTKEAFNALLKILEEPVSHIHFILATTEPQKIPATVLSRAQHFEFRRLTPAIIVKQLAAICEHERIASEPAALDTIAAAAEGSLRDALVLVEQFSQEGTLTAAQVEENLGLVQHEVIADFLEQIERRQTKLALGTISKVYEAGMSLSHFAAAVTNEVRSRMLVATEEQHSTRAQYYRSILELLIPCIQQLKDAPIPQLPLELVVIKLEHLALEQIPKSVTPHSATPATSAPDAQATPVASSVSPATPAPAAESGVIPSLTMARVRERWNEIISQVTAPKVRLTLRTAKLGSLHNGTLTLVFPSQFELAQVNSIEGKGAIETAIESVLSEHITIACEHNPAVKPVSITTETIARPLPPASSRKPARPVSISADEGASILGGTLIQE